MQWTDDRATSRAGMAFRKLYATFNGATDAPDDHHRKGSQTRRAGRAS